MNPAAPSNSSQLNPMHSPKIASVWLVVLISLWHLILAAGVNLSVDEAHYALYGAKLDWSYFDHPPMVGWLNSVALLFSSSDLALRVMPILLFALSSLMLYRIAIRLYPEFKWVGFWSLLLIHSAIMFQLLSLSMLPDTPVILAALMVFWQLLNLLDTEKPALKNWLWLGFWLGVAGLSKYTAVTLVVSLIWVMLFEKRYVWLKTKGLWLAVLIALVMISPVLVWNAQNDWVSILYQLNHGTHNDHWDWLRVLQTQLAQLGVYSPLLFLLGWWLAITSLIQSSSTRLLALFALPTLVLFAMGSGYEMSLPHWTQLAWLFMTPAVVIYVWRHWHKKLTRVLVYSNGLLVLVASMLLNSQLISPWLPFTEKHNPVQELTGWPEALAKANQLQQTHNQAPLFAANWTQASRIAWYSQPVQKVYVTDNRFDQFDFWYGNAPAQSDGIVILPSYEADAPKTFAQGQPGQFKQCQKLDELAIEQHGTLIVRYRFFYCQGFQPAKYSGWAAKLPIVQSIEAQQFD